MRLILSGDMIDAAEAKEIGLVDLVFPAEELRAKTLELAAKIAARARSRSRSPRRRCAPRSGYRSRRASLYERDLFCLCFSSEDKKEGVAAFLAKRPAAWTGR